MSEVFIRWKEVTRVERLLDDDYGFNILYHVVYFL